MLTITSIKDPHHPGVCCPNTFLLAPGPFSIYPFPFLPTTATPSHCPYPYSFRDPPRCPTTLSRQSYPVFSFAQFSNSSIIYLCFSITSRLIDELAMHLLKPEEGKEVA